MTDDEPEDRGPSVEEREGNVPEPPVRNDTTDGKVSIDVEGRFPEIRRLKVSGAVLFIMAGLSAVLPLVLLGGGFELSPNKENHDRQSRKRSRPTAWAKPAESR